MLMFSLLVYREFVESNYMWFLIPCLATSTLSRIGLGMSSPSHVRFALVYAFLSEFLVLASLLYLVIERLSKGPGYLHLDLRSNGTFLFALVLFGHVFLLLVGGVLIAMLFIELKELKPVKRTPNKLL